MKRISIFSGSRSTGSLRIAGALLLVGFSLADALSESTGEIRVGEGMGQFLRFTGTEPNRGLVETSISGYELPDGRQVSLVSAVHIADAAYFDALNSQLAGFDVVLYEMIKDASMKPESVADSEHPIGQLQRGLKSVLKLTFQLDGIDYTKPNFVHADMDPGTFQRLQTQKGENMLTLMLQSVLSHRSSASAKAESAFSGLNLLFALSSPDRARALKYLFAREMNQFESVMAGVERGVDGTGSVILQGRNDVVMRVLSEQLRDSDKDTFAIFYGAAHMPDLETRLLALDARPIERRWLVAWDLEDGEEVAADEAADNDPNESEKEKEKGAIAAEP